MKYTKTYKPATRMGDVGKTIHLHEFDTINEFLQHLNKTPLSRFYQHRADDLFSDTNGTWTKSGTQTLDEAKDLLEHGWMPNSPKLKEQLKLSKTTVEQGNKRISTYGVAGYQASVPRYLNGIPTAMINSKIIPAKQKVITITKDISYHFGWSENSIIEEAIKALQIIQSLESGGLRVKLNVHLGTMVGSEQITFKMCIKKPDERINFSKIAFPLGHPAMLRRFLTAFIERHHEVGRDFGTSYGKPVTITELDGEYVLPIHIENPQKFIDRILK